MKNIEAIGTPLFQALPGTNISEAAKELIEFCKEYNTEAKLIHNNIVMRVNPLMEPQMVIDNYNWKQTR